MAKKVRTKKSKMSGMMDTSLISSVVKDADEITDSSISINSQLPITRKDELAIRKMLKNSPMVKCDGHPMVGNATFHFIVKDKDSDSGQYAAVTYEFKQAGKGSHIFLTARANPTKLISGKNSLPVLVSGLKNLGEENHGKHIAFLTFQLSQRLPFILLERIPSKFPFVWEGKSRKSYVDGDMIINQIQYAWYSGLLDGEVVINGETYSKREFLLHYLRACYGGDSQTEGRTVNLAQYLGLVARLWDNSSNITISSNYGKNNEFSMTLYTKDTVSKDEKTKERVENLIRFDCTFYSSFWQRQKIKTVKELEAKYLEVCNAGQYDVSFVFWLSKTIMDPIHLNYIVNMTAEKYYAIWSAIEQVKDENHSKIIEHWKNGGRFDSIGATCKQIGVSSGHFREYADQILDKYGLDVTIPDDYHRTMLVKRIMGKMSAEQQREFLNPRESNNLPDRLELIAMDKESSEVISETLGRGLNTVRGLRTRRIPYNKLWIFERIAEHDRDHA